MGYQLGLMDGDERSAIESSFTNPNELDAQCRAVAAWLAPLAADEFELPANLAARIEARIAAGPSTLKLPTDEATAKSPFLSGRDLLALAAAITLFVGVFLPSYRQARNRSMQSACANNLRDLGWATDLYRSANSDVLPFAGGVSSPAVWYRRPQQSAPTSRDLFRLVDGNYGPSEIFVDSASRGDYPMRQPSPETLDDFPDPRNSSYGFNRRLSLRPWVIYELSTRTPLAADMTPLVDANRHLRQTGPMMVNSPVHGGRGQNILYADYSVRFHPLPTLKPGEDDIYRLHDVSDSQYTGYESPRSMTDTFMTP